MDFERWLWIGEFTKHICVSYILGNSIWYTQFAEQLLIYTWWFETFPNGVSGFIESIVIFNMLSINFKRNDSMNPSQTDRKHEMP